jgi:hypothetical protein
VRLLVEQLRNSLLYRWFAGLELGEEVCRRAVFGKDTRRLLNEQVAGEFFRRERPALLRSSCGPLSRSPRARLLPALAPGQ